MQISQSGQMVYFTFTNGDRYFAEVPLIASFYLGFMVNEDGQFYDFNLRPNGLAFGFSSEETSLFLPYPHYNNTGVRYLPLVPVSSQWREGDEHVLLSFPLHGADAHFSPPLHYVYDGSDLASELISEVDFPSSIMDLLVAHSGATELSLDMRHPLISRYRWELSQHFQQLGYRVIANQITNGVTCNLMTLYAAKIEQLRYFVEREGILRLLAHPYLVQTVELLRPVSWFWYPWETAEFYQLFATGEMIEFPRFLCARSDAPILMKATSAHGVSAVRERAVQVLYRELFRPTATVLLESINETLPRAADASCFSWREMLTLVYIKSVIGSWNYREYRDKYIWLNCPV